MPTILELFKGSSKDISPNIPNQFPVQQKFKGSPQEKAVKSDQDTVIEQELTGIRFKSGVELNNPRLYGNQAIRIATRSTSDVEKMKQATGGTTGDGGLIGKGLGAITGGGFGKFVFGGKVTSLNQARDGVNSRLGIPQNIIPTYVNNTGELQKGLEPDTMITLAKIKNDAKGTLVGQFLKQTGGGTPKTIGNQLLGQGISLVKDKLRTTLFGNPNTLGANGALASVKWEYSSQLPYSKQISNVKFNSKKVNGIEESASTNITKKVTQLREDAKKKLGEAASSATALLKKNLKGTEPKAEIDKVVESKTKNTTATASTYTQKLDGYKNEDVTERIDLSLVSPIKGIDRRQTKGVFGKTEYAFSDPKNNTGKVMPFDPTRSYSGVANSQKAGTLETKYGLKNNSDSVNNIFNAGPNTENRDLIPVQMKGISDGKNQWVAFRALITGFTETVSPSWDTSKFVGNPYAFYTYSGVERSASFSLKLYCMNENELAKMWQKIDWLTRKAYPTITDTKLVNAPFITLTLGSIYTNKIGFINSLSYTIADDITWETDKNNWLPKVVDVQLEFKIVEFTGQEELLYGTTRSTDATKAINTKRKEVNTPTINVNPITTPTLPTQPQQAPAEPLKVNSKGEEQTPTPPSENSKPKSIDTGKPAETPKQANDSSTLSSITTTSESEYAKLRNEAEKKYKSKGYPSLLALRFAMWEAGKRKITNITKLAEETYYFEVTTSEGEIREKVWHPVEVFYAVTMDGNNYKKEYQLIDYAKWSSDNGGKDPMNKLFSKEQMGNTSTTGKLQASSF